MADSPIRPSRIEKYDEGDIGMQAANSSFDGQSDSTYSGSSTHSRHIITPKRVGYTMAGAFVFVSAAVTLGSPTADQRSSGSVQTFKVEQNSSSTSASQPDSTNPSPDQSAAGNTNTAETSGNSAESSLHVQVNGQDMPVPESGTTQQTIDTGNGSHTSVTITNNSSQTGSATGSSHSSFSLDVQSQTQGGDATP